MKTTPSRFAATAPAMSSRRGAHPDRAGRAADRPPNDNFGCTTPRCLTIIEPCIMVTDEVGSGAALPSDSPMAPIPVEPGEVPAEYRSATRAATHRHLVWIGDSHFDLEPHRM